MVEITYKGNWDPNSIGKDKEAKAIPKETEVNHYGCWDRSSLGTDIDISKIGKEPVVASPEMKSAEEKYEEKPSKIKGISEIPEEKRTMTVDKLTLAIMNSIDRGGMPREEARHMAMHVMGFFGYQERIIDNILEPQDRDPFYMLEDSGLLTTEREETTLYDGREWRIHYWLFKKEKILELAKSKKEELDPETEEVVSIYEDIPDDLWALNGNEEE